VTNTSGKPIVSVRLEHEGAKESSRRSSAAPETRAVSA
jgi:hypothetical protein